MGRLVRIDKWLWAARFFKTRSLATKACVGGRIKVAGNAVKPARELAVGDRVEWVSGIRQRIVEVVALSDKRGPASVAQTLYEDHSPAPPPKPPPFDMRERGAGRPSKRDRRKLVKLRGKW